MNTFEDYRKRPNLPVDIIEKTIRANKKHYEYNGYLKFFDKALSSISIGTDEKTMFYKKGLNVYAVHCDIDKGEFHKLEQITDENLKEYKHLPRYNKLIQEVRQYKLKKLLK